MRGFSLVMESKNTVYWLTNFGPKRGCSNGIETEHFHRTNQARSAKGAIKQFFIIRLADHVFCNNSCEN